MTGVVSTAGTASATCTGSGGAMAAGAGLATGLATGLDLGFGAGATGGALGAGVSASTTGGGTTGGGGGTIRRACMKGSGNSGSTVGDRFNSAPPSSATCATSEMPSAARP